MATQTCWRCLARSLHSSTRPTVLPPTLLIASTSSSATFSTTAHLSALNTTKAQAGPRSAQKGHRTLRLTKNKPDKQNTGRRPDPGERKALRKRIVLSNTNAFEVPGLQDLNGSSLAREDSVGRVLGLEGPVVDALRAIEAFKPSQGWGFFRRPTTLFREETLEMGRFVKRFDEGRQPETMRRIITGERGTGKSVLVVQAQAMAFMKGWVVIHIPDAQELTNATTAYEPAPDTNPTKYIQRTYTATLLSRIAKANEPVLSALSSQLTHDLPIPLQSNISLYRLADIGARDPDIAWPIFQALWRELTITNATGRETRPPLLLSLDSLAHISRLTEYLTPSMHFIHAYDLLLVDHFLTHLTGARALPNGGMVLATECFSNRPTSPSLDLAVAQSEATSAGTSTSPTALLLPSPGTAASFPSATSTTQPASPTQPPLFNPAQPYTKFDPRVLTALRAVPVLRLRGCSRPAAKTLLEYYARSGMLRAAAVTERFVAEKWTMAGGGIVGELERGCLAGYGGV